MDLEKKLLYQVLDRSSIARLALITRDNLPDVMPIVFARNEDTLFSPVDGKPKRTSKLARIRNIEANDNTMLLIDYYSREWEKLWWLKLLCLSEIVINPPNVRVYENTLIGKYEQYQKTKISYSLTDKTFIIFNIKSVKWWGFSGKDSIEEWLNHA